MPDAAPHPQADRAIAHHIRQVGGLTRAGIDATAWALALLVFTWARFDLADLPVRSAGMLGAILIAIGLQSALGALLVYRGQYLFGSREEVFVLAGVGAVITATLTGYSLLINPRPIPLSVAVLSFTGAIGLMVLARMSIHRMVGHGRAHNPGDARTVVLGAGEGGELAIRMMQTDRNNHYRPVALLDDDAAKKYLRIAGIRVMGTLDDLADVADRTNADTVLLAIPSASSEVVLRASNAAHEAGLAFRTMPPTSALMTVAPDEARRDNLLTTHAMFREISLEDLLGRNQVRTDLRAIAAYLDDKVVLVTGAGGSIGSQLSREISRFGARRLVLTDRDESALHAVQLSIEGRALLDSRDIVLGDLRTPGFIASIIEDVQPDVVFHAAALKHLSLLERFPAEAMAANALATWDLVQACHQHGVMRFVHISTDKAAEPVSVLGYSKRAAERLVATVPNAGDHRYISVRFGNVLGSRGSALQTWQAQIDTNRPLTITDPDMRRYFMSVNEACQLVLQAATIGGPGEVLVLDMGEALPVETVARRYAEFNGVSNIEVIYTGARPGEKLREVRLNSYEHDRRPHHELITQVPIPPLDEGQLEEFERLRQRSASLSPSATLAWLKRVGTEEPSGPAR